MAKEFRLIDLRENEFRIGILFSITIIATFKRAHLSNVETGATRGKALKGG